MQCRLLFFYSDNDWKDIGKHLRDIPVPYQIVTSSYSLNEFLRQLGKDSKTLREIFPEEAQLTYEVHRASKRIQSEYRKYFEEVTFQGFKIFGGIENQLLEQIILHEKVRKILEENKNTVLIFEGFTFTFFAMMKTAIQMGYESDLKIALLQGDNVEYVKPDANLTFLNYKNKFHYLKSLYFPQGFKRAISEKINSLQTLRRRTRFESKPKAKRQFQIHLPKLPHIEPPSVKPVNFARLAQLMSLPKLESIDFSKLFNKPPRIGNDALSFVVSSREYTIPRRFVTTLGRIAWGAAWGGRQTKILLRWGGALAARFGGWLGRNTRILLRWAGVVAARFGRWMGRQTKKDVGSIVRKFERSFGWTARCTKLIVMSIARESLKFAAWNMKIAKITAGISSYLVKLYLSKSLSIVNLQTTRLIFRNIDKKIQETGSEYAECAFFFTTNEEDLYLKALYPILDRLKERQVGFQVFAVDIRTASVLSKKGVQFVNLFDDVNILAEEFKKSLDGKELRKRIEQLAIKNNLSLLYVNQISGYIFSEACRAVAIMVICDHIIKQTRLKSVVIATDGQMFGNSAIAVCEKYKIPTFFIPSTIINANPLHAEWFRADKICIYGLQGLDVLTGLGYRKEKIILTGSPKYDHLKKFDQKKSRKVLEDTYHIDSNKKLIAVGMARWHEGDEIWMSELIKFSNENGFEVVIKIHPMYKSTLHEENEDKISKIAQACKNLKYHIIYDMNLYTLLSAANLVITDYSNVGAEAALLEKPILTVNFIKESLANEQRYHETGAAIYFEDYSELEKTILEIFKEGKYLEELKKGRKKMIDMYNYYNDDRAAERIIRLLLNEGSYPVIKTQ